VFSLDQQFSLLTKNQVQYTPDEAVSWPINLTGVHCTFMLRTAVTRLGWLTFLYQGDIITALSMELKNHLRGRVKFPTGGKAREHPLVQDPVTSGKNR
jgi:hypothetical protein